MPQKKHTKPLITQSSAAVLSLVGIALLFMLLMTPGNPDHFTGTYWTEHWSTIPLDLPVVVLLLVIVGHRLSFLVRLILTSLLLCLVLLQIGNLISRFAFGRAFNPLAEWHLVQQGWSLTSNTLGASEAIAFAMVGTVVLLILGVVLFRCLGYLGYISSPARKAVAALCTVLIICGLAVKVFPDHRNSFPTFRWVLAGELVERIEYTRWALKDQSEFTKVLNIDELAAHPPGFAALEGRDVVIIYIESYGRSFIDNAQYSSLATTRLQSVMDEIGGAGLHVRSAWVDSPIRGGRSWLAHSTVASGLRLTNQARFDRLISSERASLHSLFSQAGWSTSVLLPVVKTNWVEGAWYKVDRFLDFNALGYKGKGFGFVTTPDQYTLTAFERKVRSPSSKPLMAHIGLLDSHAPWGPLPKHQEWDDIDDGSLFDGSQRYGQPHSWANPEPVRKAYGTAVEQNLKLVGEYLARYAQDGLFIVMGDHQPASVIAGWAPDAYVPMHVFSKDKDLLKRLPDEFFSQGLNPESDRQALPMESLRGLIGTVFE